MRNQDSDKAGIQMYFRSLAQIIVCCTDRNQPADWPDGVFPFHVGQIGRN